MFQEYQGLVRAALADRRPFARIAQRVVRAGASFEAPSGRLRTRVLLAQPFVYMNTFLTLKCVNRLALSLERRKSADSFRSDAALAPRMRRGQVVVGRLLQILMTPCPQAGRLVEAAG